MDESDTKVIAGHDAQTIIWSLQLAPGQRVRICAGPMQGLEGTLISMRPAGRVLIRATHGFYVEVQKFLVQRVRRQSSSPDVQE